MKYIILLLLLTSCGTNPDTKPKETDTETEVKHVVEVWKNLVWKQHAKTEIINKKLVPENKPKDVELWCPNYQKLSLDQKVDFYTVLMGAMVKRESNFNPESKYKENMLDARGRPVISRGLLQISFESANQKAYSCKFKTDQEIHDPFKNLSCGVNILKHWFNKDEYIGSKVNGWKGGARYWAVLRGPSSSDTFVKKTTSDFCNSLTQPDIQVPIPSGKFESILPYIVKADKKQGLENGEPTFWLTTDHKKVFPVTYGSSRVYTPKVYADLWLLKTLNKTLTKLQALGVEGINHLGVYNYRNIAGSSTRSRHSYALAMDISGFLIKGTGYVSVKNGWHNDNSAKLKQIRAVFCEKFDTVLSPDFNSAHHDHFHVDLNPSKRGTSSAEYPVWNTMKDLKSVVIFENDINIYNEMYAEEAHGEIDYSQFESNVKSVDNKGTCR